MKEIPLTKDLVTLVDDEDHEWLSKHKWHARVCKNTCYAVHTINKVGCLAMHRLILSATNDQFVDHIDGNGLNNTRDNLRIASRRQNGHNRRISCNNTSGFKGVHWHKRAKKWEASITINGNRKHLGYYITALDGALAYDMAAQIHFGEFANLNFG